MKENVLILIGGAPTTGKSTIAKYLSKELDLPWISSDQIREFAQSLLEDQKDKYPELFNDSNFTAEEFLTKHSAKEIAEMEITQSKPTFDLMQKFIDNSYPWKSFIVEGVNILPEFLDKIKFEGKVIPVFLIDEDVDRARKVIFKRGLWGPAKSYSDDVKEKEVEWVFEFSKRLKSMCVERGINCFEVTKNDDDTIKILEYINQKISA